MRQKSNYQETSNAFLKLVRDPFFKKVIDAEDLRLLLDKRIDMIKDMYGQFFTSGVAAVAALIAVHYFAKLGATYESELAVAAGIGFSALVWYSHRLLGSFRPLIAQARMMEQYLYAKAELHEPENSGGKPSVQQLE